jgi:tetratricopeptide (TPR) repeat protein
MSENRFEEAIDAYQESIKANPKAIGPFFNMGLAYKKLKKYDHAAAAFSGALQLDPDNLDLHRSLGNIYNLMEQWGKAIEHLNLVVHRRQNDAEAHGNLGWAYYQYKEGPRFKLLVVSNLEKAVELFEKQNMKEAAVATQKTLDEVNREFGYSSKK